ncbi:NADH dehydrogenase (ubiquinone) Fe-S protein 8 [Ceratobasidium sp. AG-Ba]|nr:NADH dehydrogenase (ubiquinone) Fe-S protein 8 [Ceratobasidium sp. AG-Ba]QRW02039.1 hypothetical protein RhiLY_01036 [Ceratobasidium sp. AG-Ba]
MASLARLRPVLRVPVRNTATLLGLSYRGFTTTFPRFHAAPVDRPSRSNPADVTRTGGATPPQFVNPYQEKSALDKAAELFFFTEILRGMWIVLEQFFRPPYTIK